MTGISLSGYMPYMTVASLEMSDEPKKSLVCLYARQTFNSLECCTEIIQLQQLRYLLLQCQLLRLLLRLQLLLLLQLRLSQRYG